MIFSEYFKSYFDYFYKLCKFIPSTNIIISIVYVNSMVYKVLLLFKMCCAKSFLIFHIPYILPTRYSSQTPPAPPRIITSLRTSLCYYGEFRAFPHLEPYPLFPLRIIGDFSYTLSVIYYCLYRLLRIISSLSLILSVVHFCSYGSFDVSSRFYP